MIEKNMYAPICCYSKCLSFWGLREYKDRHRDPSNFNSPEIIKKKQPLNDLGYGPYKMGSTFGGRIIRNSKVMLIIAKW